MCAGCLVILRLENSKLAIQQLDLWFLRLYTALRRGANQDDLSLQGFQFLLCRGIGSCNPLFELFQCNLGLRLGHRQRIGFQRLACSSQRSE